MTFLLWVIWMATTSSRTRLPSNVTYGPLPEPREWDRRESALDEPHPLTTADWKAMLLMLPVAFVFVVGMLVGMGFFIVAFTPR